MPKMSKELICRCLACRHLTHKVFGDILCATSSISTMIYSDSCESHKLFLVLTSRRDLTLEVIDAKPASIAFLSRVS